MNSVSEVHQLDWRAAIFFHADNGLSVTGAFDFLEFGVFMRFSRMKNLAAASALAACASMANAGVVVSTISDFSTSFDSTDWDAIGVTYNVGQFEFSVAGNILGATLTGTFGNALSASTAETFVYGDGVEVAACNLFDDCNLNETEPPLTWSYTFGVDDLALLQDGVFALTAYKGWIGAVHLGDLRLEITNDVNAVPEPVSAALLLAGLAGLGWSRRTRR